ncbi:MAG: septum formation initiator family protein [Bacteroidota bacterium]
MLKNFRSVALIISVGFAIWMLFVDDNSLLIHNDLNEEIDDLENEKAYYRNEIEKDKKAIKELSTEEGVERIAREKYYMKKENEEIFIIEYEDSLKIAENNE